jgi:hypothetical protein
VAQHVEASHAQGSDLAGPMDAAAR